MTTLGFAAACVFGMLCVYGLLACLAVSVLDVIDWWRGRRRKV